MSLSPCLPSSAIEVTSPPLWTGHPWSAAHSHRTFFQVKKEERKEVGAGEVKMGCREQSPGFSGKNSAVYEDDQEGRDDRPICG